MPQTHTHHATPPRLARPARPRAARLGILAATMLLLAAAPLLAQYADPYSSEPSPHATHAEPDESAAPAAPRAHLRGAASALDSTSPHGVDAAELDRDRRAFAAAIDIEPLREIAVFDGGRAKILDTLAREQLERIHGKTRFSDPLVSGSETYDPLFTYFDMLMAPETYAHRPVIYVEVLPLRRQLVRAGLTDADAGEPWLRAGRLPPMAFQHPDVRGVLTGTSGDLRHAKAARQVQSAVAEFENLGHRLRLLPPEPGADDWRHILEPLPAHAGATPSSAPPEPAAIEASETFLALRQAWRERDIDAVNDRIRAVAAALPAVAPDAYPAGWQRAAEHWYNVTRRFTVGHVAYFLAAILLLIAMGAQRRWLTVTGVTLLCAGLAVHLGGFVVRALISGRWPIHNQYESFFALALFGVITGLIFMAARKEVVFGAAAALLGAASLLIAGTMPIPSREVGQVTGILATSNILYIHVNLILGSYALIGLACFISIFYLVVYYLGGGRAAKHARDAAVADIGQPASQLEAGDALGARPGLALSPTPALAAAGAAPLPADAAQAGGTAPQAPPSAPASDAGAGRDGSRKVLQSLRELDRAQMVVLQLAFWTLGVGILLGAYWADHAWGRWWAWDPKETWALITWMVYLAVIHLRFVTRRPALVTAWLSVVGFIVMLWTYWGVNLLLAGLHSYA